LFTGREVTGHPPPSRSGQRALTPVSPLVEKYKNLKPERSLILYDCGAQSRWCANADLGFPAIFSAAVKGLGLGSPDDAVHAWYRSLALEGHAAALLSPWAGASVADAPFHSLAIVNRMDFAQWTGKHWKDAELRFVYGRKPVAGVAPELTLILEFVLPDMDWAAFRDLAAKWEQLGQVADGGFAKALQDTLNASRFAQAGLVRIRTNHTVAGPWQFGEWHLTSRTTVRAGQPLERALLADQIEPKYMGAAPGTLWYWTYMQLWPDIGGLPGPRRIHIAPKFLETTTPAYSARRQTLGDHSLTMATPPKYCATEATRNTLALQRCTGCHSTETGTSFVHISNRLTGQSSTLSGFLKGSGKDPAVLDIYYGTPDQMFSVDVFYDTYRPKAPGAVCDQLVTQHTTRKFYDLGRRRLFLASVLTAPEMASDDEAFKIQMLGTDFAH